MFDSNASSVFEDLAFVIGKELRLDSLKLEVHPAAMDAFNAEKKLRHQVSIESLTDAGLYSLISLAPIPIRKVEGEPCYVIGMFRWLEAAQARNISKVHFTRLNKLSDEDVAVASWRYLIRSIFDSLHYQSGIASFEAAIRPELPKELELEIFGDFLKPSGKFLSTFGITKQTLRTSRQRFGCRSAANSERDSDESSMFERFASNPDE
ncbi:hypothetical protein [Pseudohalioglobus lutimaris]|uniref:Uncharacterized protein n=1 Tax=Pseudohalioglobus lutimaris TaxID=1737061 RepID=A0A2N5WY15_9GAMM|nr:hypothetical protein [Pseudohalioglobus lutimaris]PLW67132.1 hypothetical protein C0039_18640 [Pseudohalioglobus lutimaris]